MCCAARVELGCFIHVDCYRFFVNTKIYLRHIITHDRNSNGAIRGAIIACSCGVDVFSGVVPVGRKVGCAAIGFCTEYDFVVGIGNNTVCVIEAVGSICCYRCRSQHGRTVCCQECCIKLCPVGCGDGRPIDIGITITIIEHIT